MSALFAHLASRHASCRSRTLVVLTIAAMFIASASATSAHTFTITVVRAVFDVDDSYRIDMTVDVDALALGVPDTVDSVEVVKILREMDSAEFHSCADRAKETVLNRVRIRFDGVKVDSDVAFPDHGIDLPPDAIPTVLGITARLTGNIPPGAKSFTFGASRAFKLVHLSIDDRRAHATAIHMLGMAEDSPPFSLTGDGGAASFLSAASQYLKLGFEHILPKGLDHILFVLGLFLLSRQFRPLFWQVSAFTVAHTLTLALSMLEVVSLPARIVEPLIALSITYVAVENLCTAELKVWRPIVVFLFGLLHGMGFAGVLRELGLPEGQFATALISFNLGVELGQLSVVGLAFLAVGLFRERTWYRSAVVMPASFLIAAVGLYWSVQRAFFWN